MKLHYSSEKNIQILISLLKKNNISRVIVSPGSANANFVISIQQDDFFEIYSCIDERSAAYMACGLAAESQQPVVICCTGATASRNYVPALTEAYYRKLPLVAITATKNVNLIGMNIDQMIDRTSIPNDISICSVHLPSVTDANSEWECMLNVNRALQELKRNGGGPVHINLTTNYSQDFSVLELPDVNSINRLFIEDNFPLLHGRRIAIFVGSHFYWDDKLREAVDTFCERYNAVVLCDQTSNYKGKYGIFFNLITIQQEYSSKSMRFDVIIYLGDVSASVPPLCNELWRVNIDGEFRDLNKRLKYVFQMKEYAFFEKYNELSDEYELSLFDEISHEYNEIYDIMCKRSDEFGFSSIWVAYNTYNKLPDNSVLHLGILNSLRSWNFFRNNNIIGAFSNTGGYGIDGCVSTMIGASLAYPNRIFYCIVGDLAFFYDMNSLGNINIGSNIRIILVNNGLGNEFKNNLNPQQKAGIGEDANRYIAAKGHYGNLSKTLVKNYAKDLGFRYLSAKDKTEYNKIIPEIISENIGDSPLLVELFIEDMVDAEAINLIQKLKKDTCTIVKSTIKDVIGNNGIRVIKKFIKKEET